MTHFTVYYDRKSAASGWGLKKRKFNESEQQKLGSLLLIIMGSSQSCQQGQHAKLSSDPLQAEKGGNLLGSHYRGEGEEGGGAFLSSCYTTAESHSLVLEGIAKLCRMLRRYEDAL